MPLIHAAALVLNLTESVELAAAFGPANHHTAQYSLAIASLLLQWMQMQHSPKGQAAVRPSIVPFTVRFPQQ